VNAFVNICRHRGHEVVSAPCVSRKSLQCPYHGWTYDLDGSLRAAPRSEQIPGFDRTKLGLYPIKVETWGTLIFLNPDLEATPFAATFGEWQQLVLATAVDIDSLTPHETRDYPIDANWKVWIENGLECYHCALCHPGFASLMDVNDEVLFNEFEHFSTFETRTRKEDILDRQRTGDSTPYFDSAAESEDALWSWLWPNLFFSIFPGGGAMIAPARPDPTNPARCVYARQYCFPETTDEAVRRDFVEFFDQVTLEDQSVCASVQRGFTTGYYRQGPLLLESEPGIIHFQRLLDQKLNA
jgi:choline monooxygenase